MKLISWNVNGLRAVYKKGFEDFFEAIDSDIFCIQETKMQEGQLEVSIPRIFSVLEQCREKRLFWYGNILKNKTAKRNIWYRQRRT